MQHFITLLNKEKSLAVYKFIAKVETPYQNLSTIIRYIENSN